MSLETLAGHLVKALARGRRLASLTLLAASVGAGGLWVLQELSQEERDRHAVQQAVWDIERKVRRHDAGMWLLAEGELPPGHEDGSGQASHARLRADLDRLAHLESFRLLVGEIRIAGDAAFAEYVIEATRSRAGEPEPPSGGRFSFHSSGGRWVLTDNRFDEAPPLAS